MQGKKKEAFDPIYHPLVPHFMALMFPTVPHYTTTQRAAPALFHWSGQFLSTLKFKKGRLSYQKHEMSFQLCSCDGWKILSPGLENVSLKSQHLFHSFLCSYIFASHLPLSWLFYIRFAEKLISPPVDLHFSAPSEDTAWKGDLEREQPSSHCMDFHQEPETWDLMCQKEPQNILIFKY